MLLLELLEVFLAHRIGLWIYITDGIFSQRRRLPRVIFGEPGFGRS